MPKRKITPLQKVPQENPVFDIWVRVPSQKPDLIELPSNTPILVNGHLDFLISHISLIGAHFKIFLKDTWVEAQRVQPPKKVEFLVTLVLGNDYDLGIQDRLSRALTHWNREDEDYDILKIKVEEFVPTKAELANPVKKA
jgi:hypothetical protein